MLSSISGAIVASILLAQTSISIALPSAAANTVAWATPPISGFHRHRCQTTSCGARTGVQGLSALRGGGPKIPILGLFKRARRQSLTSRGISSGAGEESQAAGMSSKTIGRLELTFVALLYGSLTVAFRFLYSLEGPPTASTLSFARGILAAACFIPAIWPSSKKQSEGSSALTKVSAGTFWIAATEMAFWNLGSQGLLNVGLLYTEASRGSFLTQLSVVLTPIVSIFAGQKVGLDVGIGSIMALVGVVILSTSESAVSAAAGVAPGFLGINVGDIFCILGALCWSLNIFRLSSWVNKGIEPVALQAWKTIILSGMYFVWMFIEVAKSGWAWNLLWPGIAGSAVGLAVLAFSAIGPGAIADVMQSQAQQKVSASEANVILSSEPLWALLFGVVLLGEIVTFKGALGGGIIVAAALVASGVFTLAPKGDKTDE